MGMVNRRFSGQACGSCGRRKPLSADGFCHSEAGEGRPKRRPKRCQDMAFGADGAAAKPPTDSVMAAPAINDRHTVPTRLFIRTSISRDKTIE